MSADHRPGLQWAAADVDVSRQWAESGAQWLTAPGVAVPGRLVRGVVGLVEHLDSHGAGLAGMLGARGLGVLAERAAALGFGPSGRVSAGEASRLLPCVDGWVAASLTRGDDWDLVPAWLGPGVQRGWDAVAAALRVSPRHAVVERARLLGLACCAVGETDDARPVLLDSAGDSDPLPLDGLVVANLAALWAGPLAADVLARLGARVITVESTARPDGARATPAFHDALHGRSESVALDLRTPHGLARLRALAAAVDVVIEGSRPRALAQMGIDATSIVAEGPRVWVSITAHGRKAPHGEWIGYGDDTAAAGGLVGTHDGGPVFIADAVADPVTGLIVAAAVADLCASGGRWMVDIALSRVAAWLAPRDDDPAVKPLDDPLRPRRRSDEGRPLPLGRDTETVLAQLGIDG